MEWSKAHPNISKMIHTQILRLHIESKMDKLIILLLHTAQFRGVVYFIGSVVAMDHRLALDEVLITLLYWLTE